MMKNKEIEIKLQIKNKKEIDKIREYLFCMAKEADKNIEKIKMKAVYYDTESGFLRKHRMAYRIRRENKSIVATYKSGTVNKNGVFKRVEVNRSVNTLTPEISVFADDINVWKMLKDVENNSFEAIVITDFIRECVIIKWQNSNIEIALDLGSVAGKNNKSAISEIELELKDGIENDLIELKNELIKKFNIEPSTVSKYHKGLILAGLE